MGDPGNHKVIKGTPGPVDYVDKMKAITREPGTQDGKEYQLQALRA